MCLKCCAAEVLKHVLSSSGHNIHFLFQQLCHWYELCTSVYIFIFDFLRVKSECHPSQPRMHTHPPQTSMHTHTHPTLTCVHTQTIAKQLLACIHGWVYYWLLSCCDLERTQVDQQWSQRKTMFVFKIACVLCIYVYMAFSWGLSHLPHLWKRLRCTCISCFTLPWYESDTYTLCVCVCMFVTN